MSLPSLVPNDPWLYRLPWTRAMMFIYCVSCVMVGIIGIADSSLSIKNTPGQLGVILYSCTLIGSGLVGAFGIFRNLQATVVSIWAISVATFFHGIAILAEEGYIQTGLRLIIAPFMMIPVVWAWRQWLILVKNVRETGLLRWPRK